MAEPVARAGQPDFQGATPRLGTDVGGRHARVGPVRLVLLPPGQIDVRLRLGVHLLDVNLGHVEHQLAVNSDRWDPIVVPSNSFAILPKDTTLALSVNNPLPGLVVEIDDWLMRHWLDDAGIPAPHAPHLYRHDIEASRIARAGIAHLAAVAHDYIAQDHLIVEAMALALAGRAMARLAQPHGDLDAEVGSWHRRGSRPRLDRALDMAESRISDPALRIADLAEAAGLASSQFSEVFKALTGESPYAFILRRRAEFARDLIIGTRQKLSEVAYAAGFSSQAHMTLVFRRHFGTTPAAMRR
jgi:AraC-like DNA-binding protein